jgi:hypothetical protein
LSPSPLEEIEEIEETLAPLGISVLAGAVVERALLEGLWALEERPW